MFRSPTCYSKAVLNEEFDLNIRFVRGVKALLCPTTVLNSAPNLLSTRCSWSDNFLQAMKRWRSARNFDASPVPELRSSRAIFWMGSVNVLSWPKGWHWNWDTFTIHTSYIWLLKPAKERMKCFSIFLMHLKWSVQFGSDVRLDDMSWIGGQLTNQPLPRLSWSWAYLASTKIRDDGDKLLCIFRLLHEIHPNMENRWLNLKQHGLLNAFLQKMVQGEALHSGVIAVLAQHHERKQTICTTCLITVLCSMHGIWEAAPMF